MASWKKVITGSVASGDISSSAVTTAKIASSAVTTAKIASDAVTDAKLADFAVYGDIIMDEGIGSGKLADDSVATDNIEDDAVTGAKIASNTISYLSFYTNNSAGSGQYLQAQGGGTGMGWQTLTVNNSTWSGTDLSVANGGTGASSASTARGKNNLDVNQGGHLGYPTRIKVLPSDFLPDSDNSTSNYALTSADNGGTGRIMSEYLEIIGNFNIPSGFKATHVTLYGAAYLTTSRTFQVYECNIANNSDVLKGTGSMSTSPTTLNITDVTATDTNYLSIRIDLANTNDRFYGGYITIARV